MKNLTYLIVASIFTITSSSYGIDAASTPLPVFSPPPAAVATPTPKVDTTFTKSAGITDSADKTKDANKSGQALNKAMGAVNLGIAAACFGTCSSGGGCCPVAPIFLLMGIQNLAQAGAQGKTAGQAAGTIGQTDTGYSGYDPSAADNDPELKKGLDFVASVSNVNPKGGFSYDPVTKTVTAANGKTLKASDVNSPAAMAAAGVGQGTIDMVSSMSEKALAAATKKAEKYGKIVVNGEEGSSGGGGGSASSVSSGSGGASYGQGVGAGRSGLGVDRDPAQVAGMQKNYNGEPIGVAGDSIFKMMTRRYKTKESQNIFLDDAELLIQK